MHYPETIRRSVYLLFLLLVSAASTVSLAEQAPLAWPEIEQQQRPWTYWWWMGSAADAGNITAQLETFQQAGLGGVHIIPIYGAKGAEDRYLKYLSPEWMAMLEHTVREAERLGMGVDMTTGTGWCFGGPSITDELANVFVQHETRDLESGRTLEGKFDSNLKAIIAYAEDGQHVDLTDRVGSDGAIEWVIPDGNWQLLTAWPKPMRNVKRAAPGGAGRMLNAFYRPAIDAFLQDFTTAFDAYDGPLPRSLYHDSYEYQCNWAPDIIAEFENRRGYKLQGYLLKLLSDVKSDDDQTRRVRADYNRTLSELMLSDFLEPWVDWCHARGMITRNEAHGSPGNLLDLYAVADIPESEMFRLDRDPLVTKFSSSAAHVAGRKLVSNETGTWLRDHFHVTLADLKQLVDELFVSGVNHVFYHGTCYSPADAKWPGWVFYAATQMNPRNSIWRDGPVLNTYIARCQAILQGGKPDNDVLLYWPIEDFWHSTPKLAPPLTVHHVEWLKEQAIGNSADLLWQRGYAFDYISDAQLQNIAVNDSGAIASSDSHYQVLVVPPCKHMPLATIKRLLTLADNGAKIIFEGGLPTDVPGLTMLETRQTELRELLAALQKQGDDPANIRSVKVGQGTVWIGALDQSLLAAGVSREELVDRGVKFIRRKRGTTREYFLANLGDEPIRDWVTLSRPARSVIIMDPMSGDTGIARTRLRKAGQIEIYLQLGDGESLILRALDDAPVDAPQWEYLVPASDPVEVAGDWRIEFVDGGPSTPEPFSTRQLKSWTELGGEDAKRFAGTARYSFTFDAPETNAELWRLDLGDCRESARVSLNGNLLGTLIIAPFHLDLPADLLRATGNHLEIEVTNLSTNRIADLDRRGVEWKIFHDANIVNIDYKPFDASAWPIRPSGLLGPVSLQRMQNDPALLKSKEVTDSTGQLTEIPLEWVDPATGFRVVRMSRRVGDNRSFYFHNTPFVPAVSGEGDKMVFYGSTKNGKQLFTLNLKTLATQQLTNASRISGEIVSPLLREAFYQSRNIVYAVNVDTAEKRKVATLPEELPGSVKTINADGTLLAGVSRTGHREILRQFPKKSGYFERIFEAKLPSKLFTLNVKTGELTFVHEKKAWLNHLQFSPTDPQRLMFCHEGPWHKLHRIWQLDLETNEVSRIHERTVDREIAGHEFWSRDGQTIWFDLQIPRGDSFFLAGHNLQSGSETRYQLTRNEWSVHFNISPDQTQFCGDGGARRSVANAEDGKWIYLFQPEAGRLKSTRLVNMKDHDYGLEPNAHFSPDGNWVIFRSNLHGQGHIYAVDLSSADPNRKLGNK